MYQQFFGLSEAPFSIAPNPKYLFISERHGEALKHLVYQLQQGEGGFMLLTGEVGTGKTTVSRYLLSQLPENTIIGTLNQPSVTEADLYQAVCDAFSLAYAKESSRHDLFKTLEAFLHENQRKQLKTILLLDEAQHLNPSVLEHLRLLTNLETNEHKLLQVILIGQPELNDVLCLPELRQLAQRITARYHLMPLTVDEVDAYLRYRLQTAGCFQPLFNRKAVAALHKASGGIPRIINVLADKVLQHAADNHTRHIHARWIKAAQSAQTFHTPVATPARIFSALSSVQQALLASLVFVSSSIVGWFGWQVTGIMPPAQVQIETQTIPSHINADTLHDFQRVSSNAGSEAHALQTLYKLWGVRVTLEQASASHTAVLGLKSLRTHLSIDELQNLNHAAVVSLVQDSGRPFFATLSHLDAKNATLLVGEHAWTVERTWLNAHWSGNVHIFWKLPPQDLTLIGPRAHGDAIQWLDDKVSLYLQEPKRTIHAYDPTLKARVERLQAQFNLEQDGLAGVQTLMRLNAYSDIAMPRLQG